MGERGEPEGEAKSDGDTTKAVGSPVLASCLKLPSVHLRL